jgi:cytosine/adenosine deaminase-related metal-dependent hydrolase
MATSVNAELLGMSGVRSPYAGKLGVVQEGALADLLLMDGDPIANIKLIEDPEKNLLAVLEDNGKRRSRVEGRRITFWIDTEQVEVEGSTVTLDAGGFGGSEGAKKLLGK